jgi:glutamine synthetase
MSARLDPGAPWNENLYELAEGRAASKDPLPPRLPRTLIEALDAFRDDPLVASALGAEFRDIYVRQKTKEWDQAFYKITDDERGAAMEYV